MKELSTKEMIFYFPLILAQMLPFWVVFFMHEYTDNLPLWITIPLYMYAVIQGLGKYIIGDLYSDIKHGLINHRLIIIMILSDLIFYLSPLPAYWVILMLACTSYIVAVNIRVIKKEEAKINRQKVSRYIEYIIMETQKHGTIEIPKDELSSVDSCTPYNLKDFFEQRGTLEDTLMSYYHYTLNNKGQSCARQIESIYLMRRDPFMEILSGEYSAPRPFCTLHNTSPSPAPSSDSDIPCPPSTTPAPVPSASPEGTPPTPQEHPTPTKETPDPESLQRAKRKAQLATLAYRKLMEEN